MKVEAMYSYVPHKEEKKKEGGSIGDRGYFRDDEFEDREVNWRHRQASPNFNERLHNASNRRDLFYPFGYGYDHND